LSTVDLTLGDDELTFHRFTVPVGRNPTNGLCDEPILIPSFDETHGDLSRMPSGLDYICRSSSGRIFGCSTDNERFGADSGKPINVSTNMKLDNVSLGECLSVLRVRAK
jgi:hypothetical protein